MSKEQIEEMARIIGHCESTLHPDIECHNKATVCYCIENPCTIKGLPNIFTTQATASRARGNGNLEKAVVCTFAQLAIMPHIRGKLTSGTFAPDAERK